MLKKQIREKVSPFMRYRTGYDIDPQIVQFLYEHLNDERVTKEPRPKIRQTFEDPSAIHR